MAYLALKPVSAAVYGVLNVAGLTALAAVVGDDIPQGQALPYVWFEVREADKRGFGTGGLPEVELRVHAFSAYQGMTEAQSIIQKVIELLRDQSLTVSGYAHCGQVMYDETVTVPDEVVNGVRVKELVAFFRIYVQES